MILDKNSRFASNPTNINRITRSKFDLSNNIKTSFNVGELIPFDVMEVLPGDTFDVETNVLARLQTLISPVMDNLYLDMYYFFVPNRLVWNHWKEFCGENTQSAWIPQTTYSIPQIMIETNRNVTAGTILDYMGVPLSSGTHERIYINALPVRAYNLIWNEWFRDENLQDPILIENGDTTRWYDVNDSSSGGVCLKANKYHDYFTSALPSPQKGPDVMLSVNNPTKLPILTALTDFEESDLSRNQIHFKSKLGDLGEANMNAMLHSRSGSDGGFITMGWNQHLSSETSSDLALYPSNLYANLDTFPMASINQIRLAFATQKLYEKDARGGTRYVEILKSHFGVTSPDSRLQRPELLSYNHIPVNITQIVQNSETNDTPQGHTTAISVTANSDGSFIKSFTEHGYIIGLACARYKHTYQQGLNRLWSRKNRFDFYWPVFSNIGEQPILNKEIYLDYNNTTKNDEVFGYQEAWAEYRYKPDRTSGEMRSTYSLPLDSWHFGDKYSTLPMLGSAWIQEDKTNVDRTLAVQSTTSNQLFMDIYIKNICTRPMPLYSIPGLIDHM